MFLRAKSGANIRVSPRPRTNTPGSGVGAWGVRWFGNRRHECRGRRHRGRYQWLGQFNSGHRKSHHELPIQLSRVLCRWTATTYYRRAHLTACLLSIRTQERRTSYTTRDCFGHKSFGGFNNTHLTTNIPFTTLSPEVTSGFQARVTQHLLQGFGSLPNTRLFASRRTTARFRCKLSVYKPSPPVDQIEICIGIWSSPMRT